MNSIHPEVRPVYMEYLAIEVDKYCADTGISWVNIPASTLDILRKIARTRTRLEAYEETHEIIGRLQC